MYDEDEDEILTEELAESSPTALLKTESDDLTRQIVEEKDPTKLENLTKLFELNQRKKNIARINRLSGLVEMIDDEVITRLSTAPDVFENGELVKYMDVTQKSLATLEAGLHETPMIQINQQNNEININNEGSGLSRESRKKVLDMVAQILENANKEPIETEGEEIE